MVRRGEFCATLKKVRFCGILYVTNDSFKCYIKVGEPMGENKTPEPFRKACDKFTILENLMSEQNPGNHKE